MFSNTIRRLQQGRGFTLIEMAIVLGIVGILSAGLWRLMSVGSQQSKDQAAAQQQLALINAVQGFLAETGSTTGGQAWLQNKFAGVGSTNVLPLPTSNSNPNNCAASLLALPTPFTYTDFCSYLPNSFTSGTSNSYGQTYNIYVRLDSLSGTAPQTYSFMIVTSGGSTIPDADGGRISSLIGGDGGFIYTSAVCTAGQSPTVACGTMGAWQIITTNSGTGNPAGYNVPGPIANSGEVASRTYVPVAVGGSNSWLARIVIPGDTTNYTYNTMTTNYYTSVSAQTDLYMYPYGSGAPTPLGGNNIHLNNGALMIDGPSGTVNLGSSGQIVGVGVAGNNFNPEIQLSAITNNNALIHLASAGGCTVINNLLCQPVIFAASGDISAASGEVLAQKIISTSDARLKMNIHPIEDPLASLMKIDAVAFTFRSTGTDSMGVTAQNLEKVYPQLVSEVGDRKYVEYNGLIGPLIGAVQELKRQNDDLREQLTEQKHREDLLEKKLAGKVSP